MGYNSGVAAAAENELYTIHIGDDAKLIQFEENPESGFSAPAENEESSDMYTINIADNAKLIEFEILSEEEDKTSNPYEGYCEVIVNDEDKLIPLSEITINHTPKKHFQQEGVLDDEDDDESVPFFMSKTSVPKNLSEDFLFRKLMDNFMFGTFGGAIYVRKDEVYRLVTKGSLSTLVLSVLTQAEKEKFKMHTMRGVFERMTCDPEVTGNALVIPEGRALFLNGAYDVVKRKRVEVKENDFYPFRIQANYIPNNLHAGKHFSKFLATTSNGDKEVANRIMIMIGYLLVCGFNKTIWVAGCAPNSGKSAVGRWLTDIIGDTFSAAVPPQDMGSHFVIAQLAGAPVNLALDISKKLWSDTVVSFLKASSGDDKSVFQQKFQDATSQRYMCKHLFATNYPLKIATFDRAFWNRIQVVPFTVSCPPEKQNRNLLKHMNQESDSIVTLAMEAICLVILDNWQIPPCAVADRMKRDWIGWQTGADEFLSRYCELEDSSFTSSREMYQQYLRYCALVDYPTAEETGFIQYVKSVFPELEKKKKKFHGLQRNGFCGLKMKPL